MEQKLYFFLFPICRFQKAASLCGFSPTWPSILWSMSSLVSSTHSATTNDTERCIRLSDPPQRTCPGFRLDRVHKLAKAMELVCLFDFSGSCFEGPRVCVSVCLPGNSLSHHRYKNRIRSPIRSTPAPYVPFITSPHDFLATVGRRGIGIQRHHAVPPPGRPSTYQVRPFTVFAATHKDRIKKRQGGKVAFLCMRKCEIHRFFFNSWKKKKNLVLWEWRLTTCMNLWRK